MSKGKTRLRQGPRSVRFGSDLLYHLGVGSTPRNLKPLARAWVKLGGTPKSFKVVLWGLFVLVALSVLIFIGHPLYLAITDLGRGFD